MHVDTCIYIHVHVYDSKNCTYNELRYINPLYYYRYLYEIFLLG